MGTRPIRSSGLHLTQVLNWVDKRFNYSGKGSRQQPADDDPFGPGSPWEYAAAVGFAFEDAISRAIAESAGSTLNLLRGFEVGLDGITGTPDGVDLDREEVWEIKYTWQSSVKSQPQDRWKWLAQTKGYCHMMEMSVVNFLVLYGNGDWKPPAPQLVGVRIQYEPQELAENWAMVKSGAEAMKREMIR